MKLYLDTSVVGAVLDKELPHRVYITKMLLDSIKDGKYTGIISNVVLEEIERSPSEIRDRLLIEMRDVPFQIISEDDASADLVQTYEKEEFIRKGARLDLRHIAVATVNNIDAIVSWNFRDMVNIRTRRVVHGINLQLGLPLIEIVS